MAYTINKYNGTELIVLDDGTLDTTTSLGLVGRNYVGYGETQNENFVFLLENFSSVNPPTRPLTGQIWYNSEKGLAHVYNGTSWEVIGSAVLADTAPEAPSVGALWFKTPINTLYVFNGLDWTFIGPEAAEGFGITRARTATLIDSDNITRPVILLTVNGTVIGICSSIAFTINPTNAISGFNQLVAGITISSLTDLKGDLIGNADSASRLLEARSINNVAFDGTANITLKASTTNKLVRGAYIAGSDFDGSTEQSWAVDATPSNVIGKVVARNSEGGFSASTITANLIGNVTGNVTASSGISNFDVVTANRFVGASLSGNAFSASQFETTRNINGVPFNGTSDITVPAAAGTLTGVTIKDTVLHSSLKTVGRLDSLFVADAGIAIGNGNELNFIVDSGISTIRSTTSRLNIDVGGGSGPEVSFVSGPTALSLGGENTPAMIGDNVTNIGMTGYKFNKVYANQFKGVADSATLATTATNITGGGQGSIPYQTASGTTAMLPVGANGYVLKSKTGNLVAWEELAFESLTEGSYIKLTNTSTTGDVTSYNTLTPVTVAVDATTTNTAGKVVARDGSGNFSAGTITASLSGNSTTATRLQTARTINGVAFDGSANITVSTNYVIQSGASYSIAGYTNQVGSFNDGANYFDVFPPAGRTMGNIVAFIPSIHIIHYAGGVNGDDSMRCTYAFLGDRIRVWVQNTEQRSTPAANWLAVWS
jgi:hypothetical protein